MHNGRAMGGRDEGSLPGASTRAKPSADPQTNRIASWILFVAIAGAPLPFGSRDPTTVAFWCALLGVGLLFASPRHLRPPHLWLLAGIAVVIAGYGFVLHEQLAVHPWVAQVNPIWAQASELLRRPIVPSVSIVRDEPFYALGAPLSALLALILGLVVGADRVRARQALLVMAWAGVGYAVYGILALVLEPGAVLWREKTAYVGSLTATFINRNTAATYFGSCTAVWLVLLMESVRGRLPRGPVAWRKAPGQLVTDTPAELALRFVMVFVCLAALFMTSSRGGVLFALLGCVLAFVLYFRRDLPRGKGLVLACLGAGAVALVLLQFLGGNVGARIDAGGLSDAGRLAAWRSTLRIIADNPWFGTGLGTFAWAFPPYRGSEISMQGIWDMAHSTPLELAAELGIPLASLVALAWLVALVVLARALRGSRRNTPIPLAALIVSLIALLHSAIDFSLQITGYAIVAFALLGVGLGQSFNTDEQEHAQRRRRTPRAEAAAEQEAIAKQIIAASGGRGVEESR
jgi:O-antigen ligase